jgi:tetratricopeptide (TPR) repeat protein
MARQNDIEIAKELIEEQYFVDAIKMLQKLHKNKPDSHTNRFYLALAWAASGISVDRAEKYFRKLKEDDGRLSDISRVELGRILLCKKKYEEARENLEVFSEHKGIETYAMSELLYLALREGKFEQAKRIYEYIKSDADYWTPSTKSQIEFYINYMLGKIKDKSSIRGYYFGEQVADYSEEKAIRHIKLHLDENDDKKIHSVYLDGVDVEDVYDKSKIRITEINPFNINVIDRYIINFDSPIGIVQGEETDTVSVITLPNTNDILSIYPVYNFKTRVKQKI